MQHSENTTLEKKPNEHSVEIRYGAKSRCAPWMRDLVFSIRVAVVVVFFAISARPTYELMLCTLMTSQALLTWTTLSMLPSGMAFLLWLQSTVIRCRWLTRFLRTMLAACLDFAPNCTGRMLERFRSEMNTISATRHARQSNLPLITTIRVYMYISCDKMLILQENGNNVWCHSGDMSTDTKWCVCL